MIKFDSDYLEGCFPEILRKLEETNFEQTPGYGEDEYCAHAREVIRKECGAPQAEVHFLVGGTQTNTTVIASLLRPYQGVLCAVSGHINVHETGAIEHSGHKVLTLPSSDGKITAAQISSALNDHSTGVSRVHLVQPAMVYISFSTELGTIYTLSELKEISSVCRSAGIPLFIDGARMGYALMSPSCDITLKDIAALADVFYLGGTKQGALFGEAVVFCNTALAGDFRYNIKQNGGMLAKGRLLGIQFSTLFEEGLYFSAAKKAVEQALKLKKAFMDHGFSFFVDSPTNQQFPILPNELICRLREKFSFEDWECVDEDHTAVRFCTSWATLDSSVDALISNL